MWHIRVVYHQIKRENVKGKLVPWPKKQAMRIYSGIKVKFYAFLSTVLYGGDKLSSPSGRFAPIPLIRRLSGPKSHCGHCAERKNLNAPTGV
jgi:hypothetical protein